MSEATASTSSRRSRFFDLMHETGDKLSLIKFNRQKIPSLLEQAIIPIQQHRAFKIDADIQNKVSLAKNGCSKEGDINNLSVDESAAIQLYTIESNIEQESLFYVLNFTLRLADRSLLEPVLPYFQLLIEALEKLPSFNGLVYRGVNGNISSNFVKGKKLTWWGFSSCTRSIAVLSKDEFLGKNGQRTLFYIECINGKSIEKYSYSSPDDEEVLLLPGTEFLVTGKKRANRDLTIVHLQEIFSKRYICDDTEAVHVVEMKPSEQVDFHDEVDFHDQVDFYDQVKGKMCGHGCNLSQALRCCSCSDRRPYYSLGSYEKYIDGTGFRYEASRNEYYCSTCKLREDLS